MIEMKKVAPILTLRGAAFALLLLRPASVLGGEVDCTDPEQYETCLSREGAAIEDAVQETYHALEAHIQGEQLKQLRRSQAAWLAYRDADCASAVARLAQPAGTEAELSKCRSNHNQIRYTRLITFVYND